MSLQTTNSERHLVEQELAATLVRVVCLAMLLPIGVNLVRAAMYPAIAAELVVVAAGMGLATLLALIVAHIGRPRIAGSVLVGVSFVVLAVVSSTYDGVRSPAYIGLLSVTFFSVWLVGLAGGALVVIAAMVVGYTLLVAEAGGQLAFSTGFTNPQLFWHSLLTQMVLAVVLQGLLVRRVRQATSEQLHSETRYKALFEHAADAIFVADARTGMLVDANPRACELVGRSLPELRAMHHAALHPPEQRDEACAAFTRAPQGPPGLSSGFLVVHADGRAIPVEIATSVVQTAGDQVVLGIFRDVSDRQRTADLSRANALLQAEVTVRRQVEQALRESEARFRRMSDNAPDIIYRYEYEPEPRFVYVSPSFEIITGYTPDECYADPLITRRLMHPDDRPMVRQLLADPEALRGPIEMRWLHRSGAVVWLEQRNVPLFNTEGAIVAIEGIARDITGRKRSLEALRESDLRYRDLLANLRQSVVVFQGERLIFCNQALAEALGTTVEHLLTCSLEQLAAMLYPDDRPRLFETMMMTLKVGSLVADDPFRFCRADDGAVRWLHAASSLITYEGRPAILSVLSDITELKTTEERLRQSEARLKILLDSTPAVIFTARADGDYDATFVSDSVRSVLGYEPARYTDETGFWAEHIHPDDAPRIFAGMAQLFAQGWHQHEYRFLHADGSYRWVEDGMTLVHLGGDKTEIVGYLIDITRRKEAEEALRQSRDVLRAANLELARAARLKDEFLANMSHELRTPLNTVLGRAELLAEEIHGPLNERQRRSVVSIEESGRHLLDLINDILDLSKIEADKLDLQHEPVSVSDLCEASIRLVAEAARKKTITIKSNVDAQVVLLVGDPRRLKQILVNLLSNAVKFTPHGGRIGLEVSGDPGSGMAAFTVWDTGIGIAEADLPRLFRPFEQLDSRLSRQYEGTGLGLSLVSRLVRLHGGDVTVTSAPGLGSRFTVTLPWRPREGT